MPPRRQTGYSSQVGGPLVARKWSEITGDLEEMAVTRTQTPKSSNSGKKLPRDGLDCGRSLEESLKM